MALTISLPTSRFFSGIQGLLDSRLPFSANLTKRKVSAARKTKRSSGLITLFSLNTLRSLDSQRTSSGLFGSKLFSRKPFNRSFKQIAIVVIVSVLVIALAYGYVRSRLITSQSSTANQESSQAAILATAEVNRDFDFVGRNAAGLPSNRVKFIITKAEKTKEVLVQGRPANAKGDKAFLVLNIEIENSTVEALYLKPADLLRLVADDDRKYAPDIHSDIVEIQPISTKITRVGFVVFEKNKEFKIQIGELAEEKEVLDVVL